MRKSREARPPSSSETDPASIWLVGDVLPPQSGFQGYGVFMAISESEGEGEEIGGIALSIIDLALDDMENLMEDSKENTPSGSKEERESKAGIYGLFGTYNDSNSKRDVITSAMDEAEQSFNRRVIEIVPNPGSFQSGDTAADIISSGGTFVITADEDGSGGDKTMYGLFGTYDGNNSDDFGGTGPDISPPHSGADVIPSFEQTVPYTDRYPSLKK